MRGCLRAVGCMVLLIMMTCGAAWFSRDWWLPKVGLRPSPTVSAATWEGATEAGARRVDAVIRQMQSKSGPAYANLSAGDLLSYLLVELGEDIPKSVDSIQAAVIGDRVYVRANVKTADIPREVIGPFGSLLSDRTRVMLGGPMRVVRPGTSEMQVKEAFLGSIRIPAVMIPTLLKQAAIGDRRPNTAPDGFEFPTPNYIGDVRIANGRITVYRTTGTRH